MRNYGNDWHAGPALLCDELNNHVMPGLIAELNNTGMVLLGDCAPQKSCELGTSEALKQLIRLGPDPSGSPRRLRRSD